MSNSASDQDARPRRKEKTDRRDATAPRLQYQALVEVGAGPDGGFEAESVDVSLDGMRMRTAYMPREGERLVCRFDGFGGEIVAEGEVIWLEEHGRGGEFGVRFTNLEKGAFGLLEELCDLPGEEQVVEAPQSSKAALPGSRVRLHIAGLGSPMRARVREAASGEVLIGSNLEFLKVGRNVELEDVERSRTRIAHIEHVGVDIDPETNVPQLVVALSYERPRDEAAHDDDLTTAPFRVGGRLAIQQETTPEPTVIDDEPHTPSIGRASLSLTTSARPGRVSHTPMREAVTQDPPPAEMDEMDEPAEMDAEEEPEEAADPSRPPGPSMQQRVGALARAIAPKLRTAGNGATSAIGGMLSSLRKRRAERAEENAKSRAPKRTTAPPPSGALRSDGKRLVRDRASEADDAAPPSEPPKSDKKRAVFGALLGLLAVLAIYFASSHLYAGKGKDEPVADAKEADAEPTAAPAAAAAAPEGDIPTGEVPLFGATPLSTTEPVPVPPDPEDAPPPGADSGEDPPADGEAAPAKAVHLDKEWGVGEVTDPTVLRLKMDGAIDGITGSETATGFTITVPGRKSTSSAAGFKAMDKRLDSVNVVNYPDRAEVTLLFKKDVPAFVAKAQGKRLIIELSGAKKGDKADKDSGEGDDADAESEEKPKKKASKKKKKKP